VSSTVRRGDWAHTPDGRLALALAIGWARDVGGLDVAGLEDAWIALGQATTRKQRHHALGAFGPVRSLARQLLRDVESERSDHLPSYWTSAEVVPLSGGLWEARIGWGGTIHQAGEWPSVDLALAALRALRPGAEIEIVE